MNRRTFLVLGAGGLLVSQPVFAADDSYPIRLRGKVDTISGNSLSLTLRSGDKTSLQLPAGTRFVWLTESHLNEIQKGSYVGTAAVSQPDGTLKALEVQVFPASMRGVGEGTRDWDLGAGSSMTNGTVGSLTAANGRMITITYNGGEKHVLVPDNVPIVTYEPADISALTPGANVLVNGTHNADGTIVASSVSIGKNGLVPPM
jgi:Domain of unknown function (DUF5666)